MKAVRIDSLGGPETLVYGELPDPEPREGEALVRVKACSLNHLDLWVRNGIPAYKIKLPHVLGNDIAGEIVALGPGVSGLREGARVLVSPGKSCWNCAFCLRGQDNLCVGYGILGANAGWGGYAELAAVPARNILPIPEGVSFEEAASFPLTFLTSWHMLITKVRLKPGQTALILGAGSGIGVAAIQIARLVGARVIAASTSAEKLQEAKNLGADALIHLPQEDLLKRTIRLTSGQGVDVVFEHVGPATFPEALKCLKSGGILVTCGATTGPVTQLDLRYVFSRELRIAGAHMGTLQELHTLVEILSQHKLKPVVDKVFPLKEARQAQEYLADRKQFGKVVLQIP